jgi:hypothetical protein
LNEQEKAAFAATEFVYQKIPELPPLPEMCI